MKKALSIILSLILILTASFAMSLNSALAVETEQNDTVVLPKFIDDNGNEINLPYTSQVIPASVAKGSGISLEKNVTGLPLQTLFTFKASSDSNTTIRVEGAKGKGVLFYVEMPESLNGEATRLCLYLVITDGQTGYTNRIRYQWGYTDWYCLSKGNSAWTAKYITNYGIPLDGGFKGYVYIPLDSIDYGADALPEAENSGIDAEDILTGIDFQTAGSTMTSDGSMSADSEITVSAPIVVKGDFYDSALPDTKKVTAGGEEAYLFAGSKPYIGSIAHTKLGVPDGKYTVSKGDANATMIEIDSIIPLTEASSYQFSGLTSNGRTFTSSASVADNDAAIGVVYYVETTMKDPEFTFYLSTSEAGTQTSYGYGAFYFLRAEDSSWRGTDAGIVVGGATDSYRRRILAEDGFKGYIYHPFSGDISYTPFESGHYTESSIQIHPNSTEGGVAAWVDKNGNEAVIKVSNPLVVTSFDEYSSLVTVDGGELVNPFSGESGEPVDYYAPDEFIGNASLVNNGVTDNVLSLELGSDPVRSAKGAVFDATGTFYADADNGFRLSLEKNNTVFKEPLLRVVSTDTEKRYAKNIATMFFNEMEASKYDGYMLYMRNNSDSDFHFALQPYPKKEDWNTQSWDQISVSSIPFLTERDGKWQWSYLGKSSAKSIFTYTLPAGEGGFLYLSNDILGNGFGYKELVIRTADDYDTETYWTADCDFVVSAPLFVKNYSDKNAGIAFVNGGSIAQDLLSGDFACQNDYNGDLAVNILDLVRGKVTDADISDFRNSYLSVYAK